MSVEIGNCDVLVNINSCLLCACYGILSAAFFAMHFCNRYSGKIFVSAYINKQNMTVNKIRPFVPFWYIYIYIYIYIHMCVRVCVCGVCGVCVVCVWCVCVCVCVCVCANSVSLSHFDFECANN